MAPLLRRAAFLLPVVVLPACAAPAHRPTPLARAVEAAARPILDMDPDLVWIDAHNRLVELAPASLAYLAGHPGLTRPVAPDDLRVLVHTSLVRLLIVPAARPRLSANCLETTLDVLHFDLKVAGQRVGTPFRPDRRLPRAWHELYPAEFDHDLGGRIDAEADRRAVRSWWLEHRDRLPAVALAHRLTPRTDELWRLLGRRYADCWSYEPEPHAVRCSGSPPERVMIRRASYDYNLVRATCIWLGSSGRADVRDGLIELVASSSPIVAHNALFALSYVADERIRDVLQRYQDVLEAPHPPAAPARPAPAELTWRAIRRNRGA